MPESNTEFSPVPTPDTSLNSPENNSIITIEDMKSGSTILNLEIATAIRLGKMEPIGVDQSLEFFRKEHGKTTDAHCVWLLTEASAADKLDEVQREFPDASRRAKAIIDYMERERPGDIKSVLNRVQSPDWSPDRIKKIQEDAAKLAEVLLKGLKKDNN